MESERVHRGVSKIQAIWKGYKLRKSLLETRKEYEDIFNEIQRNFNDGIGIEWPSVRLCMPVFTRISEKQLPSSDVKVTTENVEISTENVIDDDAPTVSESDGIRTEYDNQRVANDNSSKNSTTNSENNPIASDDNCSRTSRSGSIRATKDDNVDLIKDNGNVRIANENASDRSRSNSLQSDKNEIAERDSDGSTPLSLTLNDSDERTKTVDSHTDVSSSRQWHQVNKQNAKIRGDEVTQNNSNTGDFLELNSNAATGCSRQQHDTIPLRTNERSTSTPRAGEFDDALHEDITDIGCKRSVDSFNFVETSSEISVIENGKNSAGNNAHILTDSWITNKSFCSVDTRASVDNKSESELLKMKEDLSLELLWIGQAITSRKVYLRMKHGT